ncbi:MAG: 1-acyl-sn-glycerol-3-phosphate acyltransferase [Bacteroidales bacterium]|nr:1-acyl-sn-glycerol-3-phosphate acyltransferase [Bacteroidales bacterium]
MLDFSKINKPNFFYSLVLSHVRYVHNVLYYRKYKVLHKDRLPKDEGSLVISNHQNGLNDALAILMMGARNQMVFIARGDLFKKDSLGKIMRFLRILPAFRVRDAGTEGLKDNDLIFEESSRIISEGDNVVIFPEATHQHGHYLNVFKKGFARIAFRTAEKAGFSKDIKILPLGLHYDTYFHIESRLLVNVGEPFTFSELYDIYREHPEKAQHLLAEKSREKVKELMLDIEDWDNYDSVWMVCNMYHRPWLKQRRILPLFENEFEADVQINRRLQEYHASDEPAYLNLMSKVAVYRENLEKLNLRDWIFSRKVFVWSWLRGLLWLCYAPFVLATFLINIIPYSASNLLTAKMKDRQLHASLHIGLGVLVVVPIWSLIVLALVWIFSKHFWIGLLAMLVWPYSLKLYYHMKVDFLKLYNRFRRTRFILTKNKLFHETKALRASIMEQLDSLFKSSGD